MKISVLILALINLGAFAFASADCTFVFTNKSKYPVTVQGYFLEGGDQVSEQAWLTVGPTQIVSQIRSGKKCNSSYRHTGQIATRVDLKDSTGYWIGNKGFLFAADRSYSHYSNATNAYSEGDRARADNGGQITLSNATKVTAKEFKVYICDASIDSDDCHQ